MTLQDNKTLIHAAKDKIAAVVATHGQQRWDLATRWMEISKSLQKLRGTRGVPLNASNAYFKALELLAMFPDLPTNARMFDNASLPGDFIRAALRARPALDWRANSLLGGLEDRYHLYRDHPHRWCMNADMNGDVTVSSNLDAIMQSLGDWRADLYTSDLGFAVSNYYNEELEHLAAHTAQVQLGLRMLAVGGHMVVKTFTMHEASTHQLLAHCMSWFDKFSIVKPTSSKSDNSECYWVGWRRLAQPTEEKLYTSGVMEMCRVLSSNQAKKIESNIADFLCRRRHTHDIQNWCRMYL